MLPYLVLPRCVSRYSILGGLTALVLSGFALAAPAAADPGAIQDPTGCTSGSAVASCRAVPDTGQRARDGGRLDDSSGQRGLSNGDRLRKSSPLPSEGLRDRAPELLPPPGSTGLGGGSTGIGGGSTGLGN